MDKKPLSQHPLHCEHWINFFRKNYCVITKNRTQNRLFYSQILWPLDLTMARTKNRWKGRLTLEDSCIKIIMNIVCSYCKNSTVNISIFYNSLIYIYFNLNFVYFLRSSLMFRTKTRRQMIPVQLAVNRLRSIVHHWEPSIRESFPYVPFLFFFSSSLKQNISLLKNKNRRL